MTLTRDEMIAAVMAQRNFQELISPIITELNSNEAKRGYASSLLIGACAELSHATGEGFEDALDELVAIAKEKNKSKRS